MIDFINASEAATISEVQALTFYVYVISCDHQYCHLFLK